ncbi:MAG: membrane protein [Rubricoccaceae bacterium]
MPASPLPLLAALGGVVLYHLSQKAIPGDAAPYVVIGLAYAVGLATCVAVVLASGTSIAETLRSAWRPAVGVGLGALTIEAGFLLAYRAGWPLSSAGLLVNVAAAIVLLVVGLAFFRETLTVQQWIGVAACVVGLVLISSK